MTVTEKTLTFNQEMVQRFASGEPPAAAALRSRAWAEYGRLPVPSKEDEAWRRTDISALDLDRFQASRPVSSEAGAAPELFAGSVGEAEAVLLDQDGRTYRRVPPDLEGKGVIFSDLSAALKTHGDLVLKHLARVVPPEQGKFEALNAALWTRGVFLYVPRNVDAGVVFRGGHGASLSDGQAVLPRTLIVLEEGARAAYLDDYVSPAVPGAAEDPQALSCGAVEIFLGADAELKYVNLQRWGRGVNHFLTQNARLERNARLSTLAAALGGRLSKVNLGSQLLGQGASSRLYGLVFGAADQHFTHHTWQDHSVPNTTSDLLFKAALKDTSRSIYTGLIRIEKTAQKSEAYQACKNILLSPRARANAIPMLEILADDVRCGHGAAVGSLDDDQRFYLMSRGLSRQEAEQSIVEGFFEDVLQKVPMEGLPERLRAAVDAKLAGTA